MKVKLLSGVRLFAIQWTAAYKGPPSMGFSRQEYWSGCHRLVPTRALELSKGQRANIYTDSKYAYLTLHTHSAIWKERQCKRTTGEPIKPFKEVQRLLTTIYCPKGVAVMHCKGHSRDGSKVAEGNQLADCQARKAAL